MAAKRTGQTCRFLPLIVLLFACATIIALLLRSGRLSGDDASTSPPLQIQLAKPEAQSPMQAKLEAKAPMQATSTSQAQQTKGNPLMVPSLATAPRQSPLWDLHALVVSAGEAGSASVNCSNVYGLPFLQNWRGQREDLCIPAEGGGSPSSKIYAFPVTMPTDFFPDGEISRPRVKRNLALESFDIVLRDSFDYTNGTKAGSVRAACKLQPRGGLWDFAEKRGGQAVMKTELADQQGPVVAQACGPGANLSHIVEHPVLLLHRYDTTNAYHNIEDVLAVFTTLAMIDAADVKELGIQVGAYGASMSTLLGAMHPMINAADDAKKSDVQMIVSHLMLGSALMRGLSGEGSTSPSPSQVVIGDSHSLGFYPEIWQRLSSPYPVRHYPLDVTQHLFVPPGLLTICRSSLAPLLHTAPNPEGKGVPSPPLPLLLAAPNPEGGAIPSQYLLPARDPFQLRRPLDTAWILAVWQLQDKLGVSINGGQEPLQVWHGPCPS